MNGYNNNINGQNQYGNNLNNGYQMGGNQPNNQVSQGQGYMNNQIPNSNITPNSFSNSTPTQGITGIQTPYNVPNQQPLNNQTPMQGQSIPNTQQPFNNSTSNNQAPLNNLSNSNSIIKNNPTPTNLNNNKNNVPPKNKKEPSSTSSVLLTMIMMIIIFGCILYIGSTLGYVTFNFSGKENQESTPIIDNNITNENTVTNNSNEVKLQEQNFKSSVETLATWVKNQKSLKETEQNENLKKLCINGCREKTTFTEETSKIFEDAGLKKENYDITKSTIQIDENNNICIILTTSQTGEFNKIEETTIKSSNCKSDDNDDTTESSGTSNVSASQSSINNSNANNNQSSSSSSSNNTSTQGTINNNQ